MASLTLVENLALWGPPILTIVVTVWYFYYTGKKQTLHVMGEGGEK